MYIIMSRNQSLLKEINNKIALVSDKIASVLKKKLLSDIGKNRKTTLEKVNEYLDTIVSMDTDGKKVNEAMIKKQMKMKRTDLKIGDKINNVIKERNREIRKYESKALGGIFNEKIVYAEDIPELDRLNRKFISDVMATGELIIRNIVKSKLNTIKDPKIGLYAITTIKYMMHNQDGDEKESYFNSKVQSLYPSSNVETYVHRVMEEFRKNLEMSKDGSDWKFDRFESFRFKTSQYKLATGKAYFELPSALQNTKACVNPINPNDNRCFEWCLLLHWHYDKYNGKKNQPAHMKHYEEHYEKLKKPEGVVYPIGEDMIKQYEELNNIQINVFELLEDVEGELREKIQMVYKSEQHREDVCNILLVNDKCRQHYVWIKNISRLFASNVYRKSKHLCSHCFKAHRSEQLLNAHMVLCCNAVSSALSDLDVKYELPEKGAVMKYVNRGRHYVHPFHIIADFESTLLPCSEKVVSADEETTTEKYQKHVPNSYGLKFCSDHKQHDGDVEIYNNSNPELVKRNFIMAIEKYAKKAYFLLIANKNNILEFDSEMHNNSVECPYCEERYDTNNYKCKHHDHCTGYYIGPACRKCNLKMCVKPFIPVYLHNLKGYDAHLFVSALGRYGSQGGSIECIPSNEEKYISFSKKIKVSTYQVLDTITDEFEDKDIYMEIRFLDTLGFMSDSLDNLSKDLSAQSDEYDALKKVFRNTSKHFTKEDDFRMMIKKGIYPYDYISSYDKLNEKSLPSKEMFYSKLSKSHCSDKAYAQAKSVWKHFKCKTMLDYHNLYLKSE